MINVPQQAVKLRVAAYVRVSTALEMGDYKGPTVSHGKLVYRNRMCVLPINSNTDVYALSESNIGTLKHTQSMTNLVTRVVVLGKASDDSKQKIEATVDGDTSFGIIQQVVTRGDDSLSEAKEAAQEILD